MGKVNQPGRRKFAVASSMALYGMACLSLISLEEMGLSLAVLDG